MLNCIFLIIFGKVELKPVMIKFHNIIDFFSEKCNYYASDVFIKNYDGKKYTYSAFKEITAKTTHFLKTYDIQNDDRVSILLPNIPEYISLLLGVLANGGIAVNLNINFTEEEIKTRLIDSGVSMVITTPELHKKIKVVLKELNIKKIVLVSAVLNENSDCFYSIERIINTDYSSDIILPQFDSSKIAFLQYTGGTTGGIKAAILTHENILANIRQINNHFGGCLTERKEIMPATFPFYHVFALTFNVFTFLNVGATCLLYPVSKDLPQLIKLIKENKITFFVGVNTLYKLLLQSGQLFKEDFSNLKVCIGGGEHIQYKTKVDWESLSGVAIYEAYGMTETSAMAIVNPISDLNDLETIGIPIPETEIRLLDEHDNSITEDNIHGEIVLKGPQVIRKYWNKPDENIQSFLNDWLRTGDIAVWKNGKYLKIVDRKKDMISVSGFKVFPNEVEAVIASYIGINDCAVVGEKDEQTGEKVVLYYVSEKLIDIAALTEHCKKYLTSYKIPKKIIKVELIPKTAIGKTMRSSLRRLLEPI